MSKKLLKKKHSAFDDDLDEEPAEQISFFERSKNPKKTASFHPISAAPAIISEPKPLQWGLNVLSNKKSLQKPSSIMKSILEKKQPSNNSYNVKQYSSTSDSVQSQPVSFNDIPIDSFGKSILTKYGWKEGFGIGRNASTIETQSEHSYKSVVKNESKGIGFADKLSASHTKEKPTCNYPEISMQKHKFWLKEGIFLLHKETNSVGFVQNESISIQDDIGFVCNLVLLPDKTLLHNVAESELQPVLLDGTNRVRVLVGTKSGKLGFVLERNDEKKEILVQIDGELETVERFSYDFVTSCL